ncbi:MAG: class I SAM-dependent methyltransferase [Flavobacteriaceae bacterium]|nr:class I SAM-dependent methyltransferase [Flavobacteriaceae bacterium]
MKNINESNSSCSITTKNSCCCASEETTSTKDLKSHWNKAYTNSPEEKLGWFETDLSPMLQLINNSEVKKNARIINIGAGSTTLIDELIRQEYTHLIATDISEVALKKLENRVDNKNIDFIVDDILNSKKLNTINRVDLWIDRAVLHFFTEEKDQDTYFNLLKSKISSKGFVILAEFNLRGAKKCSGLDIFQYDTAMLQNKLGSDFKLLEAFDYNYTMPSGDIRKYIYTLFKKN